MEAGQKQGTKKTNRSKSRVKVNGAEACEKQIRGQTSTIVWLQRDKGSPEKSGKK